MALKSRNAISKQVCKSPAHFRPKKEPKSPGIYQHVCPKCGAKSIYGVYGVIF